MDNNKIFIGIFVIAIIVCILSPFLASGDPDGLEASAEHINPKVLDSEQVVSPVMPDYTLEGMEDNPLVGVACLIVGAVLTVLIAYGVFKLISKKSTN